MRAHRLSAARWLVAGLGLAAAFIAIGCSPERRDGVAITGLAALPQRERNLAIYDAFCERLDQHYYDPKLLEIPEWRTRLAEWREKAAAAPDDLRLYADVFLQLTQQFPHSHVDVLPPAATAATPAPTPAKTRSDHLMALMSSGPGFDLIQLRRGQGKNTVVGDVIAGSPADRAGIEPGWPVMSWSVDGAGDSVRFRGEFLRVTREQMRDMERDLSIHFAGVTTAEQGRAMLAANIVKVEYRYELLRRNPPFDSKILPGGVTYLRFDSFGDAALIDRVVAAIDSATPQGLIVDLRRNPGGAALELRRVLGRLLGHDAYIGTTRQGRSIRNMRTATTNPQYTGPIALLIGPGTSSAAEIAAAALHDNKRGLLVGRMTNGSVLSSNYFPLAGGWRVFLPTSDFVRGGDRRIEGVGVEPDLWEVPTLEDIRAGRDPVIERALQELRKIPQARVNVRFSRGDV